MAVSKYDIELDLAKTPDTSHAYMVEMVGSNKRVLDVGCATGYLAKALGAFGNKVSGVEYDPAAAEQARPYLDKVLVGDVDSLDLVGEFGEGAFDVVVFGDVLEHLRDPLPTLRQARPLLAVGGSVVISVPNIAHGDVRLALLKGKFEYRNLGLLDETHVRFFTRDSLGTFLADGGFALADIRRTRAELFTTEIGVRPDDYDPALVDQVRADPEAMTYQFVVRAVRDDATHLDAEMRERVERQDLRIVDLEKKVKKLTEEREAAHADRHEAQSELETARASLAEQQRLAQEYRDEIRQIHQSKVMRVTKGPRAVWGRIRGAALGDHERR